MACQRRRSALPDSTPPTAAPDDNRDTTRPGRYWRENDAASAAPTRRAAHCGSTRATGVPARAGSAQRGAAAAVAGPSRRDPSLAQAIPAPRRRAVFPAEAPGSQFLARRQLPEQLPFLNKPIEAQGRSRPSSPKSPAVRKSSSDHTTPMQYVYQVIHGGGNQDRLAGHPS